MNALDDVKYLKVQKEEANVKLHTLRQNGFLLDLYEIRKDENHVYIPVSSEYESENLITMSVEPREQKVMPTGHAGSFDLIGHIALIHERRGLDTDSVVSFILKSKPNIGTIYLDRGIHGDMRLRDLQILHGEDNSLTTYRENNIIMKVDVKKVYFSPRLSTERMLLAKSAKDGEKIYDMFCGIGPITLNIGRTRNCKIFACDMNPDAIKLMIENLSSNKLMSTVFVNEDDSYAVLEELNSMDRIIMNNPVSKYKDLDRVVAKLKLGGHLNIYFVDNQEGIGNEMSKLLDYGLELEMKRVVHGYSSSRSLYSLQYRRTK